MANFYTWTSDELGLNIDEMDQEHQVLIKKMNHLYNCVEEKKDLKEIEDSINDLATFTIKHFSNEEEYMQKIGFDGLVTHKIIHKQLLDQFQQHVDNFKKTHSVEQNFFNFLKVWLTSHIRGIDMKYSNFSKGKK